jgi:effector-binding domain-containing protein
MDPAVFDYEIGLPIDKPVAPKGRVAPGKVPALRAARTVYHGPYEGLATAWMELDAWIKAQGQQAAAGLWETYLVDPSSNPDPASWRTELTRPLEG